MRQAVPNETGLQVPKNMAPSEPSARQQLSMATALGITPRGNVCQGAITMPSPNAPFAGDHEA